MRVVIGLIAVMSMGALVQALATEPEPQSATAPQPAQDTSPPAQAAPSPPDLQAGAKEPVADQKAAAPASADSATKPPVVMKNGKPELTHDEQLLVNKGYKVQVVNGEKIFCRREEVLGSRLGEQKVCGTLSQFTQQGNNQRDDLRNELKVRTQPINK